jgi:hypothetical protein
MTIICSAYATRARAIRFAGETIRTTGDAALLHAARGFVGPLRPRANRVEPMPVFSGFIGVRVRLVLQKLKGTLGSR